MNNTNDKHISNNINSSLKLNFSKMKDIDIPDCPLVI